MEIRASESIGPKIPASPTFPILYFSFEQFPILFLFTIFYY